MSSFDYTDNFSDFSDLINRAEVLTEARKYGDYHQSLGGVRKKIAAAGLNSPTLDTISFIRTLLFNLGIISHDEMLAAKKGGIKDKGNSLLALLDSNKKKIAGKIDEIVARVETDLPDYIAGAGTNRGREEKYAAQAQKIAQKLARDIRSGEDVGDAVEATIDLTTGGGMVDDMNLANAGEQIDKIVSQDPTTLIEIRIKDADRAENVSKIVSKFANKDGVEVTGNIIQFSVDPDMPLAIAAKNLALNGKEHEIEAALKEEVDKISDSVVILHLPVDVKDRADEDFEEDNMYGTEGDESYGAEENEVSEPEVDEEDGNWIQKAVDPEHEGYCTPMSKPTCTPRRKALARTFKKMGEERKEEGQEELDHFLTKEQPEDYIPSPDYEDVLNDLVNKDKKEHALKKLNGDGERHRHSPMLDSYQTSTAGYLTEQAASDKRNKKPEVKNKSFKEKYKPKTHWQLQELRKYGL